jgi:signal transduction histidine kinase
MIHFLRWSALAFAYFICAIAALWAIGALYFDLPWTALALHGVASIILASAFVSALIFLSGYLVQTHTNSEALGPVATPRATLSSADDAQACCH